MSDEPEDDDEPTPYERLVSLSHESNRRLKERTELSKEFIRAWMTDYVDFLGCDEERAVYMELGPEMEPGKEKWPVTRAVPRLVHGRDGYLYFAVALWIYDKDEPLGQLTTILGVRVEGKKIRVRCGRDFLCDPDDPDSLEPVHEYLLQDAISTFDDDSFTRTIGFKP